MREGLAARLLGPGNEYGDLFGIKRFAGGQPAFGVAADAADQVAEVLADDHAADRLVVEPVIAQVMLIEEVTEGTVSHVVQQSGQAHQRFDVAPAGHVGADLPQALVKLPDRAAGQVHGPQHVLEARVLGRGEDPPGRLQLVDLPQPLDPGVVDDLLFRHLPLRHARPGR